MFLQCISVLSKSSLYEQLTVNYIHDTASYDTYASYATYKHCIPYATYKLHRVCNLKYESMRIDFKAVLTLY